MSRAGWDVWQSAFTISGHDKVYYHLERANQNGLCFCCCERALVAVPDQLDCPWCGCGWLFSCAQCGKAFTYAKPVRINQALRELVDRDMLGRGHKANEVWFQQATDYLASQLVTIQPHRTYVYLDGSVIPIGSRNIAFDGWYAKHELQVLPHELEIEEPGALNKILGAASYWQDRRLPEQSGDAA